MKKNYLLVGALWCLSQVGLTQPVDSIRSMMANPESDYLELQQKMNNYVTGGGTVDQSLIKAYNRHQAYYGPYLGADGTVDHFYPGFLTQSAALAQPLPNINGCGVGPSKGWQSLGPNMVDNLIAPNQGNSYAINMGNNGRLTSVAIDKVNNLVYAGSESGGLWRKTIGTDNWENITDKIGFPALGIQEIAIHPTNPNEIYCATAYGGYQGMHGYGIGLIHTTDGGDTWERINFSNNQYDKEAIAVVYTDFPPYTLFASVGNELYRYDGNNFIEVFSTHPNPAPGSTYRKLIRDIRFVAPQNGAPRRIFISTHDVFAFQEAELMYHDLDATNNLQLVNNANNWQTVNLIKTNPHNVKRIAIDISRNNPQSIIASYGEGSVVEVIKSDDYGITWASVFNTNSATSRTGMNFYRNDIAFSKLTSNNNQVFYNAAVEFLKTNLNTGNKWKTVPGFHDDVRDIEIIIRNGVEEIWVAHDGGLHRSTDQGSTWILEHKNMTIGEYYDVGIAESHSDIIAGALDIGTHWNKNGVWFGFLRGGDGSPALFFDDDENYGLFHVNGDPYYFDRQNEQAFTIAFSQSNNEVFMGCPQIQNPVHGDRALLGQYDLFEYDLTAHKNVNFQTSFVTQGPPIYTKLSNFGNNKITGIAMSHSDENVIWVSNVRTGENNASLYKTTTKGGPSGTDWTDMSSTLTIGSNHILNYNNGDQHITDVLVDPDNQNHVYLSISGVVPGAYKVVRSLGGGNSWADFTGSLPNVAVHELEMIDAYPNNVLLAATDLGVYYRVLDNNSDWECYNNGLPPTIVKNFEVKYCTRELYAATIGHGIYKADLSDLWPQKKVGTGGATVNWTTNQTFYSDVVVEEGATLNITGATISMAGGAKIIVKKGGKLNVSNSILTSYCDAFWGGIEIWSDPNAQTQYCNSGCLVGKVVIQNSTIEKADIAINSDQDGVYVNGGGVINATNVHFLNNRKAIAFAKFENHSPGTSTVMDNASRFKDCIFEIDANYMFDVKPPRDQMITAWEVRGVQFYGCDFKNTSGQPLEVAGIYLHNAHFVVTDYCTNSNIPCTSHKKSTFKHLASGITALSTGLDYHFVVDHAEFTDCRFGVATSAVDYAVVTNNHFEITNDFLFHKPTAIFLENSDQYTVQENFIENTMINYSPPEPPVGIPFLGDDRGIVVKNSGAGNNAIYKNTFKEVYVGNTAFGTNFNPGEPNKGLEYGCNELAGSKYRDFNVYTIDQPGGIAGAQGGNNRPVDNMFTSNIVNPEGHIANDGANPIIYYHRADDGGYVFEPLKISGNVTTSQVNITFNINDHCPSRLGNVMDQNPKGLATGGRSLLIRNDFDGALNAYSQAKYVYVSTIDGGDTYGLLNSVQSSNAQTAWDLRTELINASPLSIEVIMETIEEGVLSNALLHDVIMVNPHAVRNEEVMHVLETKTNPMPAYMINTLLGIYEGQTQKDVLEAEMASAMQDAREAMRQIYVDWRADSIDPYDDSLLIYNQQLHTPEADWNSVAYLVTRGNLEDAQIVKNAIPGKFELGDWATNQYDVLNDYYNTWINLIQNDAVQNPSESQKSALEQLAAQPELKGGRMAKNYLMWLNEETYWPVLPDALAGKKAWRNPRAPRVETPQKTMEMYPVPANSYVTLKMQNIEAQTSVQIQVINTAGQVMLTHRDQVQNGMVINLMTQNLAPGSYFVLIYQNEVLFEKQPLEVIH
ncbi:T9SS type A sorting domain-containing protein [bacterium SCSIO 12643]|nr:T9SS type A sorting domain-containing protein [bacterium SCSIO 12643]